MKIELITGENSIHLSSVLKAKKFPIDIFLPNEVWYMRNKTVKAVFSSYPIYKDGECFDMSCDIVISSWVSDIIAQIGKVLRKQYNHMAKDMETFHSFEDLYVESLVLDTDSNTITWDLGS